MSDGRSMLFGNGSEPARRPSKVTFQDVDAAASAAAHGSGLTYPTRRDDSPSTFALQPKVAFNHPPLVGQYPLHPINAVNPFAFTPVVVTPAINPAATPMSMYSTEFTVPTTRVLPVARATRCAKCVPVQHVGYPVELNSDQAPLRIVRRHERPVVYRQAVEVRYLRPPTPPPQAPIIVRERRVVAPAPPPLVVVQRPPQPVTPPPLTIRENPPALPLQVRPQIIEKTVAVPPPPRQVIIQKWPAAPPKPRRIILEKWLPYKRQVRQVIHQKLGPIVVPKPRNVIVEYESPRAVAVKEVTFQGVIRADPATYNATRSALTGEVRYVDKIDLTTFLPAHQIPAVELQEDPVAAVEHRVAQPEVVRYYHANPAPAPVATVERVVQPQYVRYFQDQAPAVTAQPVQTVTVTRSPSYVSAVQAQVAAPVRVQVVQNHDFDYGRNLVRDFQGRLVLP